MKLPESVPKLLCLIILCDSCWELYFVLSVVQIWLLYDVLSKFFMPLRSSLKLWGFTPCWVVCVCVGGVGVGGLGVKIKVFKDYCQYRLQNERIQKFYQGWSKRLRPIYDNYTKVCEFIKFVRFEFLHRGMGMGSSSNSEYVIFWWFGDGD